MICVKIAVQDKNMDYWNVLAQKN